MRMYDCEDHLPYAQCHALNVNFTVSGANFWVYLICEIIIFSEHNTHYAILNLGSFMCDAFCDILVRWFLEK